MYKKKTITNIIVYIKKFRKKWQRKVSFKFVFFVVLLFIFFDFFLYCYRVLTGTVRLLLEEKLGKSGEVRCALLRSVYSSINLKFLKINRT